MFRRAHRDMRVGKYSTPGVPADAQVAVERLYLEYCPGGDMGEFLAWLGERGKSLEEHDVWTLFHNLALACSVCHRGTTDLRRASWEHEMVHLDLKPMNGMQD